MSIRSLSFTVGIMLAAFVVMAGAQTTSVFTTGLSAPAKITRSPLGNLFVTETLGAANSGRVSIIDTDGSARTLIAGLPAGIGLEGPSGPTGIALRGRTLFVAIGEGDTLVAGPLPNTTVANATPSSPLLSSILAIHFSANVEKVTDGFSLTMADQLRLASGRRVTKTNGRGDSVTIELVTDLPNTAANPIPPFPQNLRASNPFGIVVQGDQLYVADGGMNSVWSVKISSGEFATLTVFPPRPNPLPFGPPVIEAVPAGINYFNDRLLVALFTGFPFVPGLSEVRHVNRKTGASSVFIGGRSSAIDIVPGPSEGSTYVLEFSTNMLADEPGQLLYFETPASAPVGVASGLVSPSGMVRDHTSGDIYITEIFTGRIIRVQF